MKNIYYSLFICVSLFLYGCSGESIHPDLKLFQLNGKVKSLSYSFSTNGNAKVCPGVGMDFYGTHYVYEFDEDGKWTNPQDDVVRNSKGYIIKMGQHEFEWDDEGRLKKRIDADEYNSPIPLNVFIYYYSNGNIVDSLQHNDGGDGGVRHTYMYEGNNDEHHNWLSVKIVRSLPEFENQYVDEFIFERNINYWTEEDLEATKKKDVEVSSDTPNNSYDEREEDVSVNTSRNSITADFRTEIDVRTFLCRYTFIDNEGNRITFSNMANQLEMNGRAMTSVLNVLSFSSDEAELSFQGPYGKSRFYLAVEDGKAGLMDRNDFSVYDAK